MMDASSLVRRGLIESAFELYTLLEKQGLLKDKPSMWWPAYGSFEVVVGAILTQNAQWKRVEVSLENLRRESALELKSFAGLTLETLEDLIMPSGLYRSKARYLRLLAEAMLKDFGDFEHFCDEVDRGWLLKQKGIGPESADSILCYACKRPAFVVDAYTLRLLRAFDYEFDSYDGLQEWCVQGLSAHFDEDEYSKVYAEFHGMIVEYVKANSKGKTVTIDKLFYKDNR